MRSKQLQIFLLIVFAVAVVGCGGGSSGTGVPGGFVSKVITGKVTDERSSPVRNALVTVVETGDSTATDNSGSFKLETSTAEFVQLEIVSSDFRSTIEVDQAAGSDGAENGERVNLSIQINRRTGVTQIGQLDVRAKIVGQCDRAFENLPIIRQGNKLSSGTVCPIQVVVRNGGLGLSGVPFRVEHSRCDLEEWILDEEAFTDSVGIGSLRFTFRDSDEYCQYRIIAPYQVDGLRDTIYPVRTFRKQAFDQGNVR